MKKFKILYGVCGIGNGHTQRQLPLIEHFSRQSRLVIFAYGESYKYYFTHLKGNDNITLVKVAIPYYISNDNGIDFSATAKLKINQQNFLAINCQAMAEAEKILGRPDLVITDYEPVSAQYAYAHGTPLISIDQQSKYLVGDFSQRINGYNCLDEIMRLKMFFPLAAERIACSFFNVIKKKKGENVSIFPPTIKDSILNLKTEPTTEPISILVYLSSQKDLKQGIEKNINIFSQKIKVDFHIFTSSSLKISPELKAVKNCFFYEHGDKRFLEVLKQCSGIISTAGHTLLSEAMYLNIPVYAIPLPLYEQQMNAEVIDKNGFGVSADKISEEKLNYFLENLDRFKKNIKSDRKILLKGSGLKKIIAFIEKKYLS